MTTAKAFLTGAVAAFLLAPVVIIILSLVGPLENVYGGLVTAGMGYVVYRTWRSNYCECGGRIKADIRKGRVVHICESCGKEAV